MPVTDFSPLELVVLPKCVSTSLVSKARDIVDPGSYTVDTKAHVVGEVKVGEPFSQVYKATIPYEQMVYALASRLSKRLVDAAIQEVYSGQMQSLTSKEHVATLIDAMRDDGVRQCRGKVTVNLNIDPLRY